MTTLAIVEHPVAAYQHAQSIAVGVGELVVTDDPETILSVPALGSCVAVCLWDPRARVAGLLHFLLPDSAQHAERAGAQPGAFADTGIPLLFETAYKCGLQKGRAVVRLAGGAEITAPGSTAPQSIGKRNVLIARKLLWSNGVFIDKEVVGGLSPRSVYLSATNGRLDVKTGTEHVIFPCEASQ